MPTPTPVQRQKQITDQIEAAQVSLSKACQLACDLQGWSEQWMDIGKSHDEVNALWWRIHEAPAPGELVPI